MHLGVQIGHFIFFFHQNVFVLAALAQAEKQCLSVDRLKGEENK